MSEYFDNKQLFSSPKVSQHGNHMVMTNVVKNTRVKYINIDTKYCDEYIKPYPGTVNAQITRCLCNTNAVTPEQKIACQCLASTNYQTNMNIPTSYKTFTYTFTLPEKINDIKTLSVVNAEVPILFYNISASQGNNYFVIRSTASKVITIPDGQYTASTLVTKTNDILSSNSVNGVTVSCALDTTTNFVTFSASQSTPVVYIDFAVNSTGQKDKYNTKSKLGWLLGFRSITYTLKTSPGIKGESAINVTGQKYLYLSVDDFSKGSENSFVSFSSSSQLPNKTLAKISMDRSLYPYGTVQVASITTGALVSDKRGYNGKVDIQKLVVKLLDENGAPVNLNGADFSFCLKVEYE
jgi:hypothetical protein